MTACVNWRDDAACRDADPDLFFPIGTTGPALRQIGEAKRVCRTCPAQTHRPRFCYRRRRKGQGRGIYPGAVRRPRQDNQARQNLCFPATRT
jgi:WhiB family transcriptional regulator, redox-sensing transcriptional regulator